TGIVQQIGTPAELYRDPASTCVAGFIGSPKMNMPAGAAKGGMIEIAGAGTLPAQGARASGGVIVGVRPYGRVIGRADAAGLKGTLIGEEYLGVESYLHVRLGNGRQRVVQGHPDHGWRSGGAVSLALRPGNLHLFDAASGV